MTADQSRPVPRASAVGSIDRETLYWLLQEIVPNTFTRPEGYAAADRVLALVRPAEGVVLTPEERGDVIQALHYEAAAIVPDGGDPAIAARMRRLAYRLEVS